MSLFWWSRVQISSGRSYLFPYQGSIACYVCAYCLSELCPDYFRYSFLLPRALHQSLTRLLLPPFPVLSAIRVTSVTCLFAAPRSASVIMCTLLSSVFCFLKALGSTYFFGYFLLCSLNYRKLLGMLLTAVVPKMSLFVLFFISIPDFLLKPIFPMACFRVQGQVCPFFPSCLLLQHSHKSFSLASISKVES